MPPSPTQTVLRRAQLRKIVPLADTTIYDLERKGAFPKRFYLTPRCVVWDAGEVRAWIDERRDASINGIAARAQTPDVRLRKARPVR